MRVGELTRRESISRRMGIEDLMDAIRAGREQAEIDRETRQDLHRTRHSRYMRNWRRTKGPEYSEYRKKTWTSYYQKNKERIRIQGRNYYHANIDMKRAAARSYRRGVAGKIKSIRYDACRKGRVVELTDEELTILITSSCEYCGHEPRDGCNGIDRVDNDRDYVYGNCVPACWRCNDMKGTMSKTEWCAHMKRVLAYCNVK